MEPCCQICGQLQSECDQWVSTTHHFDGRTLPGDGYCRECFNEKMRNPTTLEEALRERLIENGCLEEADIIGDWLIIASLERIDSDQYQYALVGSSIPMVPHISMGLLTAAGKMAEFD